MQVHLGGHLSFYDAERRSWVEWPDAAPLTLRGLAERLGLPAGEIAFVAVNRRLAALDDLARPGDRVEFFPPMGGG
ncbi:MAG: ThiS family protein [Chloroflexi bacterium ADurb.Bin325]|nr:MAG: ThiS family protein [Chloroflexi bacterium ADurb.Bin325]